MPALSIVIPSYNSASWLPRSVASAFAFSNLQSEVLVVDDGSTDETTKVLHELQKTYPDLRVLKKENGGLSSARNHGIQHAYGRYVVLLDSDDELIPCDLADCLAQGVDAIKIGVEEIGLDEAIIEYVEAFEVRTGKQYLADRIAERRFHTPSWAWVYRRDYLAAAGLVFTPGLIHEDMLFTIEALLAARSVVGTPRKAYRYFKRQGSITTGIDERKLFNRIRCLSYISSALTGYANDNPDIDLGWWALRVIDYAKTLSVDAPSLRIRLSVFLMVCRFFWTYDLWGRFRTFRSIRYRLPEALKFLVTPAAQ